MRVGSLCTGYGGIELGLALAGVNVDLRWFAETEQALIGLQPPGRPNLGDITKVDWSAVEPVEMLTAGFPCQPTSSAGRQLGDADPRWLWPAVRDAISTLLPGQVLLENVRNLISYDKGRLWLGITSDLTELGYDVRWLTLGACHVGAAHHRHRVFALARRGSDIDQRAHTCDVTRIPTTACGAKDLLSTARAGDATNGHNYRNARGEPGGLAAVTLLDLLPSPTASTYGSNQGGAAGRVGPVRHSLDSMARLDLLPTPTFRDGDGRGEGDPQYWATRTAERTNGLPLAAELSLLPSPKASDSTFGGRQLGTDARTPNGRGADLIDVAASRLLPSPTSRDSSSGAGHADTSNGSPNLRTVASLLPTPRATDGVNGGPGQRGSSGDLAMPSAVQPENWGRFGAAVARHASIFGPPPAPTEPNRNGAPRLAPAFAEWLMCIPAGHVTAHLPRSAALKAIGNGVCPPQLAAAYGLLAPLSSHSPPDAEKRTPFYTDDSVTLHHGDALDVLAELADGSVDAVVTDPPYGLGFMGKEWDSGKAFVERKPQRANTFDHVGGNHNPTNSADAVRTRRVESQRFGDWCAGWAIECLRVLKPGGHLLAFGGTRTYHRLTCAIEDAGFEIRDEIAWLYGSGFPKSRNLDGDWSGWGTALKPAHEPIVVARKPLAGTVAANVLAHGTGALNVDGCRVEYEQGGTLASNPSLRTHINGGNGGEIISHEDERRVVIPNTAGRWPSNVVLDESAAAELDRQSGTLTSGANPTRRGADGDRSVLGAFAGQSDANPQRGLDTGGASRFFPVFRYQAKAPSKERPNVDGVAHPTVKPLELMRWLVRLVTPPGGVVLDPFAGSGTTAEACVLEGMSCVAIEREPTYLPLILARLDGLLASLTSHSPDATNGASMASKLAEQEKIAAIQQRARLLAESALDAHDVILASIQNFTSEAGAESLAAALMSIAASWRAESVSLEGVRTRGTPGRQSDLRAAAGLIAAVAIDVQKAAHRDGTSATTTAAGAFASAAESLGAVTVNLPGPDIAGSFGPGDLVQPTLDSTVAGLVGPPHMGDPEHQVGDTVTVGGIEFTKHGDSPFPAVMADMEQAHLAAVAHADTVRAQAAAYIGEGINVAPHVGAQPASTYQTTSLTEPAMQSAMPVFLDPASRRPMPDVKRLGFSDLLGIQRQLPSSDHKSHSQITTLEDCGVKHLLGRASRHGLAPAGQPQWANVGGTAFHLFVQVYETGPDQSTIAANYRKLWESCFASTIVDTERETNTKRDDWRVANKGLEGYDWWRVQGEEMCKLYVGHHDDARRLLSQVVRLRNADGTEGLALEMAYRLEVQGVPLDGKIDKIEVETASGRLAIVDFKAGRHEPDTFQLAIYAHAISQLWGRPLEEIEVAHWFARKGIYERHANIHERHPWDEIVYRTHAAVQREQAMPMPRVSGFCNGCEHKLSCPAGPR